jgi:rod shape-determining protein MreD
MTPPTLRRVALLLGPLLLLWAIGAELNHHLASRQVWVFVGGLHVGFIALTQGFGPGLAAVLLSGLVCDAGSPVPFGTHALLFGLAHNVIFRMRDRIPKEDPVAVTLLALFANFGLFLAFTASRGPSDASPWPRLVADLVASQVTVAVATPWFTALQARLIDLVETALELRAGRLR